LGAGGWWTNPKGVGLNVSYLAKNFYRCAGSASLSLQVIDNTIDNAISCNYNLDISCNFGLIPTPHRSNRNTRRRLGQADETGRYLGQNPAGPFFAPRWLIILSVAQKSIK
jgi:hypothetical protein